MRVLTRSFLTIATAIWLAAAGAGLCRLWVYASTPGVAGSPPGIWPAGSIVEPPSDRPVLLMFVHPRCPCSRASIGELELIMARCRGRLSAHVLFLKPDGFSDDWTKSDLWHRAASIAGVDVIQDEGAETARFSAATSGETILYDAQGRLLFHGGITASRGHAGDNAGRDAIIALLSDTQTNQRENLVFGCPLRDRDSRCLEGTDLCNK